MNQPSFCACPIRSTVLVVLGLLWSLTLQAAPPLPSVIPTGAKVTVGIANVSTGGTRGAPVVNVNQTSQRAVVDWNTFNVGKDATVNFNQPNANASTLNRVSDPNPSAIHGRINAPGEVLLVNPAGIYIGKNASLDVGAIVATTHSVSNADYMAGNPKYERNGSTGKVVNRGLIQARLEGYVALLAPEVRNSGVIVARMGSVVMASGETIVLNFDASSKLVSITTTPSKIATLIENKSAIEAPGGLIILSARATNQLVAGVIKQSGTLNTSNTTPITVANSDATSRAKGRGGRIILEGGRITLESGSKMQASGTTGGGSVIVAATESVDVAANAKISASAKQAGQGGRVTITATESITIATGVTIKARGVDGGGTVNVGTAGVSYVQLESGARTNVVAQAPTKVVTIQEGATIDASSTVRGNGGEINIWSARSTTVSGTLIARGGPLGGNGGYIETSSAGTLDLRRTTVVDVSAAKGRTGHWLLDPEDMVITSSTASAISNALSTANVTIAVVGNLTVVADAVIVALPNTSSTLTLNATGTITNSGSVSASVLALNSAAIHLATGSTTSANQVSMSAPTVSVRGTVNSYGGSIAVTGGAVVVAGTISANANGASAGAAGSGGTATTNGSGGTTTAGQSGSTSGGSGGTTGGSSGNTTGSTGGQSGSNTTSKTASGTRSRTRDPNAPDPTVVSTGPVVAGQPAPLPSVGPSVALGSPIPNLPASYTAVGTTPTLLSPAVSTPTALSLSVYAGETRALNRAIARATTNANSSGLASTINVIARASPDLRMSPDATANKIAVLTIASNSAKAPAAVSTPPAPLVAGGGTVTLDATQSVLTTAGSVISANGNNGPGGAVSVRATNIQVQGVVSASGTTGGTVRLIAPDNHGVVSLQGAVVQANGSNGRGGTVAISGKQATAMSASSVSATGVMQGGRILVGNDAPGGTLPFSVTTRLDATTTLNASQSAVASTQGGFIETSGGTLTLLSSINAGRGGMWLIDPYDITIDSTTANNIATGLNTQNVTIQTTNSSTSCTVACSSSSGSGNILVNAPINATGSYGLTLNAYGTIFLDADITTGGSQTFVGAVRLKRDTVLTANNNSSISFNSYVDSATSTAFSLSTVNGSGTTVFGAGVGTRTALSSLSVGGTGDTTIYGNVTTSGSAGQNFGGDLYFTGDTAINTGNGSFVVGGRVLLLSKLLKLLGGGGYTFSAGGVTDSGVLDGSSLALRHGAGSLRYSGGQYYWTTFNGSSLNFLAVGGGGATYWVYTGGAGGGGVMESAFTPVVGAEYTIAVGAGGYGAESSYAGETGGATSIAGSGLVTVVAAGGLGGHTSGRGGMSGQGLAGGVESTTWDATGGGGGAGTVGLNGDGNRGGAGGDGYASSITGTLVYYGAGGGGLGSGTGNSSEGGRGGGGNGAWYAGVPNSTNATGIGGGGGANYNTGVTGSTGDGGNGIVIFARTSAGSLSINSGSGQVSIAGGINHSSLGSTDFSSISITSQHASSNISGDIHGAASVSYTGTATGSLTLSGDNSFTGGTSIISGTLKIGSASALGASSSRVSVANGAVLDLSGWSMVNTNVLSLQGTGISSNGALINSSATASRYVGAVSLAGDTTIVGGAGSIELGGDTALSGAYALTLGGAQGGHVAIAIGSTVTTLTKVGAGTWMLSEDNTYSGPTNISAGTLKLGAEGVIPDSSAVTITGTLDLNANSETVASITGAGNITSGAAGTSVLTVGGNNASTTFSGQISNGSAASVGLIKNGSGVLTLSGSNTFTGSMVVSSGGLALVNGQALDNSVAVSLSTSGAALTLFNSETIGSMSAVSGTTVSLEANTLTLGSAASATISGVISGTDGSLDKVGLGTLTLSGVNTYTGITVVTDGVLKLGAANVISGSSALTVNGTLDLNGRSHGFASIAGSGTVRSSATGALVLTVGSDDSSTIFSGTIQNGTANSVAVVKVGAGELTLSGTNTFTGSLSVEAGSLRLKNGQALADSVSVDLSATGVVMTLEHSETIGSLSSVSGTTVALGSNTMTLGDATSTTIAGVISGIEGALTKVGSGVLTLSGNNTYTGLTTISEGTLKLGSSGSGATTPLGTSASGTVVAAGASLDLNGYSLTASEAIKLSGAGVSTNAGALTNSSATSATYSGLISLAASARINAAVGDLVLSNAGTITGDGFTLTLDGRGVGNSVSSVIGTGSGALIKEGSGTWSLFGANSYSGGTTISGGTLQFGDSANSGAVGEGAIDNNGILKFSRRDDVVVTNTISGTGSVMLSGAGTLILTANNNYGGTTIAAGILQVGNGGSSGSVGMGSVVNDGVLSFKRSDVVTVPNLIEGSGDVRQLGTGSLTFTNINTYTGATQISGGTLALSGTGSIQASSGVTSSAAFDISGVTSSATVKTIIAAADSTIVLGAKVLTISNSTGTIEGVISGVDGSLILSAGTLTLSGANTFTGSTTINGGVLNITADANLGAPPALASSNHLVLNGGVLSIGASFSLSSNRELGLGASGGTISVDTGAAVVVSSIVRGTTLMKTGAGQLTLSGENTFSGELTLSAGTLAVSSPANLGSGDIVLDGGTLSILNGSIFDSAQNISLSASSTLTNANIAGTTFSGNISASTLGGKSLTVTGVGHTNFTTGAISNGVGTLAFVKAGNGTLTLSGTNSYLGGTTISAGRLVLDGIATLPTGGDVSVSEGILDLGTSNATVGYFSVSNGTVIGSGTITGDAFTDTSATAGSISANLGSFNRFSKLGNGILTLSGNNSYANYYYIGNGTLALGSTNALGKQWQAGVTYTTADTQVFYGGKIYAVSADGVSTSAPTNTSGASLAADTGAVFTWLSSGATIYLSGSTLRAFDSTDYSNRFNSNTCTCTIDTNGQDITWASSFTSFGLVKTELGTLTLTGSNNLTSFGSPSLQINGGVVALGSVGALGSSPLIRFGGGSLQYSVANTTDYSAFFSQAANQLFKIDTNGQNVSFATGLVSDSGSLSKLGLGRLILSGTSTYTGATNVIAGTLVLGGSGSIATSSYVLADGVLDISGTSGASIVSLSSSGSGVGEVNLGSQTLTITEGAHTFYGVLADGGISSGTGGGITISGGRQELAGVNTYTGTTQITGGTLVVSTEDNLGAVPSAVTTNALTLNGGTLLLDGSSSSVSFSANRGVVLGASGGGVAVTSGNALTIAGVISGPSSSLFSVNAAGQAGAVKLSGLNTYAGPTTVSGGTLAVIGSSALGNAESLLTLSSATLALDNSAVSVGSLLMSGASSKVTSFGTTSLTVSGAGTLANTVVTSGAQTYTGAVTLGADTILTSTSSGDLSFSSTVSGAYSLATSTGGNTTFSGAVGSASVDPAPLTGLTITTAELSAGAIALAVTGTPALSITNSAAGSITGIISGTNTTLTKAGVGTLTLSGANTYGGATTVNGGTVVLTSTGTLGNTSSLLTLSSATLDLQSNALTVGSLVMNGTNPAITNSTGTSSLRVSGTSTLANAITTSGAQIYTGALTLGASTTLTSTSSGNLSFSSTVSGAYSLATSTAGDTTFSGAVGSASVDPAPLTGLTITTAQLSAGAIALATTGTPALSITNSAAGSIIDIISGTSATLTKSGVGTLTLSGANTYGGATTINGGALALTSTGTLGNNVSRLTLSSGSLDLQTRALAVGSLIMNGTAPAITNSTGTSSLTVSGTSTLANAITTSGAQTYTGAVTLGADTILSSTLSGSLSFSSTVSGAYSLATSTAGDTTFSGSVGSASVDPAPLTGLMITTKQLSAGAIALATTGTPALSIINSSTGAIIGIISGTNATFTKTGAGILTLSGANTYGGATTVNGGTLVLTSTGTLGNTTSLLTLSSAALDLRTNALTVGSLVMNGTNPAITNSTGMSSLLVSGASTLANAITTSGAQTYTGAVTLGANMTLTSTSSGNLNFSSTVSGAYSLATSTAGDTTFSGAMGSASVDPAPLTGLTITTKQLSAGTIALAAAGTPALSITNSAAGSITGIISGTNATFTKTGAGILTLSGANTYGGATTVNGGTLVLTSTGTLGNTTSLLTLSSAALDLRTNALTVGSLVMNGTAPAITNSTGTSSLRVSGTSTLANAITTSGAQTYTGAVALGASTTLTSTSSGNLSFDSTVSGAYSLATSTAGDTTFSGTVGSASVDPTPLTGLTITTAELSAGAITLATTGTPALSITNSAAGSITGIISGTNATLTKAGVGTLTLSGANIYGGATTVNGGTLALTSTGTLGNITSLLTLSSATLDLRTNALTVGSLVMSGTSPAITNSTGTSSLTVSGTSTLANAITTSGAQTYTGGVTLGASTTLTSTSSGNLSFDSTVSGAYSLTSSTGGNTTFSGTVGSASVDPAPLTGLTITTAELSAEAIALAVTGTPALSVTNSATGSITGIISGTYATFTKAGAGTLTLPGANTYGGATTINGGTLALTSTGTLGNNVSRLTLSSGALDLQTRALTVGSLIMNGTAPAITNSTGTSSLTVSGTSTLANAITTSGAQTYTGAVTLGADTILTSTLSGSLSFSSTVSGVYSLATSTGGNTTFSGTIGSTPLTGLTITTAQLSAGAITLAATGTPALSITNSATGSITGIISGTNATLTKAGAGILTLSGVNTYGGATTLNGGTLVLTSTGTLGNTTSLLTLSSATLDLRANALTVGSLVMNGTNPAITTSTGTSSLTVSGTSELGGNITTSGAQSYVGAMTLAGGDRTLTSSLGGSIAVGAVNGAFGLAISNGAGSITLGALGQETPLTTLTLVGSGLVTLTGDIATSGAVDLRATNRTMTFNLVDRIIDTTGRSGNGTITLGTTNSAYGLTLSSGSGTINLKGIGVSGDGMDATSLASLTLRGTGTTNLGGSIITFGAVDLKGTSRTTNVASSQIIGTGAEALLIGDINLSAGVTLTLGVAGYSNITVGAVMGPVTGEANITFSNGSQLNSASTGYVAGTGTVTVNGAIGTNIGTVWLNKTTGTTAFNGSVSLTQLKMDASAAYDLSFLGATNTFLGFYTTTPFVTSGSLVLGTQASDTFMLGGRPFELITPAFGGPSSVTLAGVFTTALTTSGAGYISLGGSGVSLVMADAVVLDSRASHGNISLASALNGSVAGSNRGLTLLAGTGSITLTGALTNMGALAMTGNEVAWNAAVEGTSTLMIQPGTTTRTINVAGPSDAGATSLDITAGQLSLLGSGFTQITVGGGTQRGVINVLASYTTASSLALATSGITNLGGNLIGTGTADLYIPGPVTLTGDDRSLTTAAGSILLGAVDSALESGATQVVTRLTSSTTWVVPSYVTAVNLLVVGGGGGGGWNAGGGGAGGGVVSQTTYSVTASSNVSVVSGTGGTAGSASVAAGRGGQSSFGAAVALGGGAGGALTAVGGDGAGLAGSPASTSGGGAGGAGDTSTLSGSSVVYGSGGGGGTSTEGAVAGAGGTNAGSGGSYTSSATSAVANTGAGGGGGGYSSDSRLASAGATGVVIISHGEQLYRALTLTSHGGTISTGTLGTTTQLKSVTISGTGNTVLGGSVSTVGAVDLSAAGRITTLIVSSTMTSSSGSTISIATVNGTTSGGQALIVNTVGATILSGPIGTSVPLASMTSNSGGTLTIRAGSIQTTGPQTYNDPVTLDVDSIFLSSGGGAIAFGSTVNSAGAEAYSLGISNGAGAVGFAGAVGAVTNGSLGAITISSSGTTTISSTLQALSLMTDAMGTTRLGASVSTAGDQRFGDAVVLDDHVGLTTSANGVVRFTNTVNSAIGESNNLTVSTGSGDITFTGEVGGSRGLGNVSLTSTGITTFSSAVAATTLVQNASTGTTAIEGGAITTGSEQSYGNNVRTSRDTALSASTVRFNGTFVSEYDLAITGAAIIGNASADSLTISGTNKYLTVSGSSSIYAATLSTSGLQTYTGAVSLYADTALTATTVIFNSSVSGSYSLAVNGDAVFGDGSGDSVVLTGTSKTLYVSGTTQINAAAITTSGAQRYSEDVSLVVVASMTTTNSNLTFKGSLNSATSSVKGLTISTGSGAVSFVAVGNTFGLGATSIRAGSLAVASTMYIEGTSSITTSTASTGAQTYSGAVSLGDTSSFTSSNSNITFSSTLNSATLARAVTIAAGTGAVSFNGSVGGVLALGFTTITAGAFNVSEDFYATGTTTINASSMQTATSKAFSVISSASATLNVDSLVVGAAMTGSAGGILTIQPRTSTTTIGLGSAASGALNLDDTELAFVNGKFGFLIIGSTAGTGAMAINYDRSFTYTQPLTLRTASAGLVTAVDTLNTGTNALTISSGTVSVVEVASGTLTVTGSSGITLNGNVTTSGSQTYAGPITLANDLTLDSRGAGTSGASIGFGAATTINGAKSLEIQAGVGSVSFGTTIGQSTALATLSVTTAHVTGVTLTGNVTTNGSQTYTGNVLLAANTTLTTNGSAGSDVTITGTVSSGLITSTVYVTFYSDSDLSGSVQTPNGSSYNYGSSSGGSASYRGYYAYYCYYSCYYYEPIYANSMTVAGGEATLYTGYGQGGSGTTFGIGNWNLSAFGGSVPSYTASNGSTPATFAVSAGSGTITLGSTVGASRSLLSLSLTSTVQISLSGSVSTLKSQTYTGPVVLTNAVTLATTNSSANPTGPTYNTNNDITFTSTVNSATSTARSLTIATGFQDISFSGVVGGVQPLSAVALTSTGTTTFSAAVYAASLIQNGTTGTTVLQGGVVAVNSRVHEATHLRPEQANLV